MINYNIPTPFQVERGVSYVISCPDQGAYTYYPLPSIRASIIHTFLDDIKEGQERKMLNLNKLKTYSDLPENWNHEGAEAFSKFTIDLAKQIIEHVDIQPEIFPLDDDTVQFEWDGQSNSYLELKIGNDTKATLFVIDKTGNETTKIIVPDALTINQIIHDFYE